MTDFDFDARRHDEGSAGYEKSALDRLRERVNERTAKPAVLIPVIERPGISVKFDVNITNEQMKSWRKKAGFDSKNGFDGFAFAMLVVANCCRGIYIDDEEVFVNDHPVSFASPEIMELVEATRAFPDCVRKLYCVDPHVEATASKLLDLAGYGDSVEEQADPSKA
jgi:hypothetical protein